jgi:hypothetical protein
MVINKFTSHELLVPRPRAQKAAYVLSGKRSVAGIQRVTGAELRLGSGIAAARTDVLVPAPGSQPGGHPA